MNKKKNLHTEEEQTAEKVRDESAEAASEISGTDEQEDASMPPCADAAAWKARAEEINDKYLRLYAEFDNYRKRTAKERIEMAKTASAEIISAMLPVLDDLERAVEAVEKSGATDATCEGIVLIYNKFKNILTRNGLEPIPAKGEVFNTDLHEAIANVPASGNSEIGIIKDEIEKGYYLNGKVLRFAKVVVAN